MTGRWLSGGGGFAAGFGFGVGAAFDFIAGTKPRAPLWMQRRGLEWLHRMVREPRRLGWRYASTNSEFILRATPQLMHYWYTRLGRGAARDGS